MHRLTMMFTSFGFSLTACASDAPDPVVGIYADHVVESVERHDGIETTIYNRDRSETLATLERSRATGLTQVSDREGPKLLDTGIDPSDLAGYNADVALTWERALRIRAGTVAYGECGSGWSEWVVPDGWWGHCCTAHDNCYGVGGTEADRERCDNQIQVCINGVYGPGNTYWAAVRAFGARYFSFWWTPPTEYQPDDPGDQ
jgi:hypothetical protein